MHMYKVVSAIHNLGNIHIFLLLAQKIRNCVLALAEHQTSSTEIKVCVYLTNYKHLKRVFWILFKHF